jgi:hypothetical protein
MPQATSCEFGTVRCGNSVENAGEGRQKCIFCRLAPDNENVSGQHWNPIDKRFKHPILVSEKRTAASARSRLAHQVRLAKDKGKKRVGRRATKAEDTTQRNIIAATRNSGRSNRDGDHVVGGQITLDTKLQSTRDNPVVLLVELAKVRDDAERAGNPIGGLVLRNRHGVGVVVFDEKDFARSILSRL